MSTRRPNPPGVYVLSKLFVCALVVVVVTRNLELIALVEMSKSQSIRTVGPELELLLVAQ